MMNAIVKAFTGRAGWLPSLLSLAIILLIAVTTVTALPRIEQRIATLIQQYLEANLSAKDSMVSVQVSGRDVLLRGHIADPALLRVGLLSLPGVRGVAIDASNTIAFPGVSSGIVPSELVDESTADVNAENNEAETREADASEAGTEMEIPSSATLDAGDIKVPLLNQSDTPVNSVAATSTGQAASDDEPHPDTQSGDTQTGNAGAERRTNPEALILSLNQQFLSSAMFAPGEAQISAELGASLMTLAEMMRQNPDLALGVETYPDLSVGGDKGAFIGFLRARNTEKFLLDQQLEDARIFTRDLSNDWSSAEEGLQLKLYILN